MAKKQTFGDKTTKKAVVQTFPVKILKWENDETRGTLRFKERLVLMKSPEEISTIDI